MTICFLTPVSSLQPGKVLIEWKLQWTAGCFNEPSGTAFFQSFIVGKLPLYFD